LEYIFFFAEKSKARILLESVAQNRAQQYSSIPDSVIAYERSLKGRRNAIWKEMNFLIAGASGHNQRLSFLRDSLISLNRHLVQFKNLLSRRYPRYHNLKFDSRIPSVTDIKTRLAKKNISAVEYFWGRHSLF